MSNTDLHLDSTRLRILERASRAVSSASGRVCRYFSVVRRLPWPRRCLTTWRSAPPANLVESNVPTLRVGRLDERTVVASALVAALFGCACCIMRVSAATELAASMSGLMQADDDSAGHTRCAGSHDARGCPRAARCAAGSRRSRIRRNDASDATLPIWSHEAWAWRRSWMRTWIIKSAFFTASLQMLSRNQLAGMWPSVSRARRAARIVLAVGAPLGPVAAVRVPAVVAAAAAE